MEIKPGKYITRNGRSAIIYEAFESQVFGRVNTYGGVWEAHCWFLDGKFMLTGPHNNDLIAPWEEPKPRLRVWRNVGSFTNCYGAIAICEKAPRGSWQPVPELDALFERSEG